MGILQKDTDLVWTHKLILRSDDPREVVLTYKKQTDRKQANDESLDGSAQASKGEAWCPFHCSSYVSQDFKRQHQNNTEKYYVWQWHQYLPMTFFPSSSRKSQRNKRQQKQTKSRSWKGNVVIISARPPHRKIMIFLYIGSLIKNKMENNSV